MKSTLFACLTLFAAIAHAQDAPESKTPAAITEASPPLFDKAKTLSRCEQPAFIKCLEMDEASCKRAMSEATDEANAAMAEEIAKAQPMSEAMASYIQGLGSGKLLGGMIKKTNGKFYTCMKR